MQLSLDNLKHYCTEEGDCWLWNLSLNNGYPQASIGSRTGILVRRYVYCLSRELRSGWRVTSSCGEKRCVNPAHLMQASPGRILKAAHADGRRCESYAKQLAGRLTNPGLPKALTDEERAHIDARYGHATFDAIAAEIGRNPGTVARYAKGETYRKAVANSSVFAWRP